MMANEPGCGNTGADFGDVVVMVECRVGTCIWHFTSSIGVSSKDVNAPDAAPAANFADSGKSLSRVGEFVWPWFLVVEDEIACSATL